MHNSMMNMAAFVVLAAAFTAGALMLASYLSTLAG